MIDIFARWVDGRLVCEPKKRRGMSKGEYLRALHACQEMNEDQDVKKPDQSESDRAECTEREIISTSTK